MKQRGFTLIELLIVVAIIAILAAIAVPNFLEAQMRSKVARCKTDLRTLAVAWEAYRLDNNEYPADYDGTWVIPVITDGEWLTYATVTTPVAYLTSVPLDQFAAQRTTSGKKDPYYQYRAVLKSMVTQLGAGWPETGTWWMMTSYGPDLEDGRFKNDPWGLWGIDVTDPVQAADYCYDASNGTKSGGDLGRTNIRSFPAN